MNIERFRQRIVDFQTAVFRLGEACDQEENSFIRDSVIQRFEFSYELCWKMLKMKLEAEGIDARSPRETVVEALSMGLISDGNAWTELHRMRNLTSHTYDEALAREVYDFVRDTGLSLLKSLSETTAAWLQD
ncbi:MAG: nucleotidyltransferase substrate binding protein [Pseudomonadota bacterium]|nr:nucleotidyltransferase substrate binding protein [Pseudomonadota bacterium]